MKGRAGFSLVELLMAVATYGLLTLVAGLTVVLLTTDLHRSRADLEAQRDLAIAQRRLAQVVHPVGATRVQAAAGRLVVLTDSGAVTFTAGAADLVQRDAAGVESRLVAGRLAYFEPSVTNGGVALHLAVRGDATTCAVQQIITFRNPP